MASGGEQHISPLFFTKFVFLSLFKYVLDSPAFFCFERVPWNFYCFSFLFIVETPGANSRVSRKTECATITTKKCINRNFNAVLPKLKSWISSAHHKSILILFVPERQNRNAFHKFTNYLTYFIFLPHVLHIAFLLFFSKAIFHLRSPSVR